MRAHKFQTKIVKSHNEVVYLFCKTSIKEAETSNFTFSDDYIVSETSVQKRNKVVMKEQQMEIRQHLQQATNKQN